MPVLYQTPIHTQYSTSTHQQYHPGSGSKMFSKCSSFMRLRTQSISGAERVGDVRSKMHADSSGAGSQAGLGSRVRPQHITHHACTDHSTSHITPAQTTAHHTCTCRPQHITHHTCTCRPQHITYHTCTDHSTSHITLAHADHSTSHITPAQTTAHHTSHLHRPQHITHHTCTGTEAY